MNKGSVPAKVIDCSRTAARALGHALLEEDPEV